MGARPRPIAPLDENERAEVERHLDTLPSLARQGSRRGRYDQEDAAQDAVWGLVAALRNLDDHRDPEPYLRSCCRTAIRDASRRARLIRVPHHRLQDDEVCGVLGLASLSWEFEGGIAAYDPWRVEHVDLRIDLEDALAKLPSEMREAVLLRLMEFTLEEVGDLLAVRPSHVDSLLRRARRKLRVLLGGYS